MAIVGHGCPIYSRLLGRDCSGRTLQSDDAVDATAPWSRDAEGRWEAEPGMGTPSLARVLGRGQACVLSSCGPGLGG